MMTQEQLDADRAALTAAQAKLEADQAQFDKESVHVTAWQKAKDAVAQFGQPAVDAVEAVWAELKAVL